MLPLKYHSARQLETPRYGGVTRLTSLGNYLFIIVQIIEA